MSLPGVSPRIAEQGCWGVSASWLWPDLEADRGLASQAEIVTLYPHRSDVSGHLWLDLLTSATHRICLYANASLFLPEDNPKSIGIIQRKAETGTDVRIVMANPDSEVCARRGVEEQLSARAVEKHIASIFLKLDLPPDTGQYHRRVMAVMRYLNS